MKKLINMYILIFGLIFTASINADAISISNNDNIQSVLSAHIDKRVTIRTKSGGELTGKVIAVTDELTHLGELSGKEFFDAVIQNKKIEAIIVRVRSK